MVFFPYSGARFYSDYSQAGYGAQFSRAMAQTSCGSAPDVICAQVYTQPNACGSAWNGDTSLSDLPIYSSTTRELSSPMRPYRSSSVRKYQMRQRYDHEDPFVSKTRRKPNNAVSVRRGRARNDYQDVSGDPPVRYLRELPRCEAEKQSVVNIDGDKQPADSYSCNRCDTLADTPRRAPLPNEDAVVGGYEQLPHSTAQEHVPQVDAGEHVLPPSGDEQTCSREYPSFLSKRHLYKTRKKTTDRPRHSMFPPQQKALQVEPLELSARKDREIRST